MTKILTNYKKMSPSGISQVLYGLRVLSGGDVMLWGVDEGSKRGI
jgi:hypothetical protein